MVSEFRILGAKRSYEFCPDDLRLTMLTEPVLRERIRQEFAFQGAQIATPIQTFGPVPPMVPPGLVFNYGVVRLEKAQLVPVRYLHVEPRRIVIDVAGPSDAIAPIFEGLMRVVADSRSPDGWPVIGEPTRLFDHSEISLRLPYPPASLLAPAVAGLLTGSMLDPTAEEGAILAPGIQVRLLSPDEEYGAQPISLYRTFHLDLRAGMRPGEGWYFSGAPTDTKTHLDLLAKLESALGL
jgi:hypothetical protein